MKKELPLPPIRVNAKHLSMKRPWSLAKKIRYFFFVITDTFIQGFGVCLSSEERREFINKKDRNQPLN